ncbi:MAG TPA: DUF521 domain-containing protein [Porticoccus sp.]|nr:DUF521 domain-containing protein [Porticoccus sp.]
MTDFLPSHQDQRRLDGKEGASLQFAMQLLSRIAVATHAERLIDISQAHLVGSYYSGPADCVFIEKLAADKACVLVPTTLNSSSADLQRPALYPANSPSVKSACRIVKLYQQMGCDIALTCAPYYLPQTPKQNEVIAWAESNAVIYANSVIGARTNKTFQYLDLCAALTGRIPEQGLYLNTNRRGQVVYQLRNIPDHWLAEDNFYQLLGFFIGDDVSDKIPVISGLPTSTSKDNLRNLGAAAGSSGNMAMFHAVGITPEAKTLEDALQWQPPIRTVIVTANDILKVKHSFTSTSKGELSTVCLGTPHFSLEEFKQVIQLLDDRKISKAITLYISTSRHVLKQLNDSHLISHFDQENIVIVTDTCTYYGDLIKNTTGTVMTASLKWAHYAPGNINVSVLFSRLTDCIESAVYGKTQINENFWKH